jgi:hypothetical protein
MFQCLIRDSNKSLRNEISTKSRHPIVPRRPLAQEPLGPMRECYQPLDRIGADLSPPVSIPNIREPAHLLLCGLPRCACAFPHGSMTATAALRRPHTPPLFPVRVSPPFADCVARTCLRSEEAVDMPSSASRRRSVTALLPASTTSSPGTPRAPPASAPHPYLIPLLPPPVR